MREESEEYAKKNFNYLNFFFAHSSLPSRIFAIFIVAMFNPFAPLR